MVNDVIQWLAMLHIIICIVYFAFFYRRSALHKCFFPFIIFFPHVWTILFLIGRTIIYEFQRSLEYNKSELMLPTYDGNSLVEIDREKETNIVPVEEALILNEHDVKRKMVIEIAKRDPAGYLEKLKMALLSEDTETAHYAASSISHLKRTNDKRLRLAKEAYEYFKDKISNRQNYITILDIVIKSKLSVEAILLGYMNDLINVLEYHISVGENITPSTYDMLLEYLIQTNKPTKALRWAKIYQDKYPDLEEPLVYELKVNYHRSSKKAFYQTLERIDSIGFSLSHETVDMIEFWKKKY